MFLLHPGPPTSEERLHAALLYAAGRRRRIPRSRGPGSRTAPPYGEAMITGLAALALHGFSSAPPLLVPRPDRRPGPPHPPAALDRLRPRSSARRAAAPEQITGLPVAPVARALADAVAELTDAGAVRRLLTEAVRGGHCEPAAVVRELNRARLLSRPARRGRRRLAARRGPGASPRTGCTRWCASTACPTRCGTSTCACPAARTSAASTPTGPTRRSRWSWTPARPATDEDALWSEYARKREHLERLGITVVHITPRKLREAMDQQATVVRTALMAAADRDPAAYVVVLPRSAQSLCAYSVSRRTPPPRRPAVPRPVAVEVHRERMAPVPRGERLGRRTVDPAAVAPDVPRSCSFFLHQAEAVALVLSPSGPSRRWSVISRSCFARQQAGPCSSAR